MGNIDINLQEYEKSVFFKKYKGTYFSDKILKNVFGYTIRVNRVYGLKKKRYEEIYDMNMEHFKTLLLFTSTISESGKEDIISKMIDSIYIDPDSNGLKEYGEILCTADGLLSKSRIFQKYGFTQKFIDEYAKYRSIPIFFFPSEPKSINQKRNSVFGDRIDYTLYDLKLYFDKVKKGNERECKLYISYCQPKTKEWLDSVGTFENLIEWFEIKGIFVDNDCNVYNLENSDRSIITDYKDNYMWKWSDDYYNNLTRAIDQFLDNSK